MEWLLIFHRRRVLLARSILCSCKRNKLRFSPKKLIQRRNQSRIQTHPKIYIYLLNSFVVVGQVGCNITMRSLYFATMCNHTLRQLWLPTVKDGMAHLEVFVISSNIQWNWQILQTLWNMVVRYSNNLFKLVKRDNSAGQCPSNTGMIPGKKVLVEYIYNQSQQFLQNCWWVKQEFLCLPLEHKEKGCLCLENLINLNTLYSSFDQYLFIYICGYFTKFHNIA